MSETKPQTDANKRLRKRSRRRHSAESRTAASAPTKMSGGGYQPLSHVDLERIHESVLTILDTVGIANMPDAATTRIVSAGGRILANKRVCMPNKLVERAITEIKRNVVLYGQLSGNELTLSDKKVYVGTGGASPLIIDLHTGMFRESTLADLYDAARLTDALENVHFFSRSFVARDMPDNYSLDVNTAYASLSGTSKHVMVSASNSDSVKAIAEMCWTIAGSKQAFINKPFLSFNINHAVSPLRVSEEAIDVLITAAELGCTVHANTFSQLGASTPVTIAGCIAQTMAETIAGMVLAWLVNPDVSVVCGPRPMLTDLRSGAMSGGSGEQALLTAAVIQMAQFYGFSNSTIAGATDSKMPDAQSGFEKSLSISLAAQAGANLITQACGVQASLMAGSFESFIIDNDMLGGILRSLAPIEVSDETLDIEQIQEAVNGEGHFLGHSQTHDRMLTDFLYPTIANRENIEDWVANGARDIRSVANDRAKDILQDHSPSHIDNLTDQQLRRKFDIKLPQFK